MPVKEKDEVVAPAKDEDVAQVKVKEVLGAGEGGCSVGQRRGYGCEDEFVTDGAVLFQIEVHWGRRKGVVHNFSPS